MGQAAVAVSKDEAMDEIQVALSALEPIINPLVHIFTPGLYTRQILMPAFVEDSNGELVQNHIVSKIHRTTHTFNVSLGKAAVYNSADDFLGIIEAPYLGVTIGGTRRLLVIIEDCIWSTHHALSYITGEENNWSDELKEMLLMKIEEDLIERRPL